MNYKAAVCLSLLIGIGSIFQTFAEPVEAYLYSTTEPLTLVERTTDKETHFYTNLFLTVRQRTSSQARIVRISGPEISDHDRDTDYVIYPNAFKNMTRVLIPQNRIFTLKQSLNVWSEHQNPNESPQLKLDAEDQIVFDSDTETPRSVPSYARSFRILNKTTLNLSETRYYLSKSILSQNVSDASSPSVGPHEPAAPLPAPALKSSVVKMESPQKTKNTSITRIEIGDASCWQRCVDSVEHFDVGINPPGLQKAVCDDTNWTLRNCEAFCMQGDFSQLSVELPIHPRSEWGAAPPRTVLTPLLNPREIVFHHEGGNGNRNSTGILNVQSAQFKGTKSSKPADDILYHYVVAFDDRTREWKAYEGRQQLTLNGKKVLAQASHVHGKEKTAVGIAILGNYSPKNKHNEMGYDPEEVFDCQRRPPPEAVAVVIALVLKIMRDYPSIQKFHTHGADTEDYPEATYEVCQIGNPKECPGKDCIPICAAINERFFKDPSP